MFSVQDVRIVEESDGKSKRDGIRVMQNVQRGKERQKRSLGGEDQKADSTARKILIKAFRT